MSVAAPLDGPPLDEEATRVSVAALVGGLLLGDADLTVAVADAGVLPEVVAELVEELAFELEDRGGTARETSAQRPVRELLDDIARGAEGDAVVLTDLPVDDAWFRDLDFARNRLMGEPMIVVATTPEGAARLQNGAPNVWSWVGGRRFAIEVTASPAALRERRLASFREATGWSDADVIARAESGALAPDPALAEWLALLGRGDLVGD